MDRRLAIAAGLAGLSLSAGCVNVMEQTAISQIAPEWFEEKTVEVKGEGYPELADIPQVRPFSGTLAEWRTQAEDLKEAAEPLEALHAQQAVARTPEEIRAMAAQWRALAEGTAVPPAGPETTNQ
jgi:hypothetical protein